MLRLGVLENASISVPAVGEVAAWNGLGDLGRRELVGIMVPLLRHRRPVLTVSWEDRSEFGSSKLARRSRVGHRRKVRRGRRHTKLSGRKLRVENSEDGRLGGYGRRRRVGACDSGATSVSLCEPPKSEIEV